MSNPYDWKHTYERKHARLRVTIGDVTYEFPEGTTREEAQAALDEAKRRYLAELKP